MNEKKENNMYYQTNIKTPRNEDISFLQLSYGNFVSLDDYMFLKKENQQLKEQLEECQLQNFNLKEDIMIKKLSFPNREIKDKSFLELYNMPSYEDLKKENQKLKRKLQQKEDIVNKAKEYIKDNANIYTNIMGKEVGFFKRHNDGWTPIELLEILDNKGE